MTNLPESALWSDDLLQLDPTTPAMGGVNGPANAQARTLGNRTQWLKERLTLFTAELLAARGGYGTLAARLAAGDQRWSALQQPPSIDLLSAHANAIGTYGTATIDLTATVTDPSGINEVEFYFGGGLLKSWKEEAGTLTASVSADWYASGTYDFAVSARNARGIWARETLSVQIVNTQPPVTPPWPIVYDHTPPVIHTVTANVGATGIQFAAWATDSESGVQAIQFHVDSHGAGTVFAWQDSNGQMVAKRSIRSVVLSNGDHTLYVDAIDGAGNCSSSTPITFTVNHEADTVPPEIHNVQCIKDGAPGLVVNVDASDDQGIARIDFYVDGACMGSLQDSTYYDPNSELPTQWTYRIPANAFHASRAYQIQVSVTDYGGNTVTAPAIAVSI